MCMTNLPTVSHMFYYQLAIPKTALTKFLKGLHQDLEECEIQMKNLIFEARNTKTI